MTNVDLKSALPMQASTSTSTETPASDSSGTAAGRGRRWVPFLCRQPGLLLAGVWLVLLLVAMIVPEVFTGRDPLGVNAAVRLESPSWSYLFGTDQLGRDVFTRVVHGTSRTLPAALLATAIGLVGGTVLGLFAGFLRSWPDAVLMRAVDVALSIPGLLLALMLIAVLGQGDTVNVAIAIGVTAIASTARVMRAEVLRVRESLYVEAARSSGSKWPRVLGVHILPNSMGPVWSMTVLLFGVAILGVTTLSFLGFGVQAPTPEWGALVSAGRNYLRQAWWMSILPGAVIAITVVAVNRLSRLADDERTQ